MTKEYNIDNATKYGWTSIGDDLNIERCNHLNEFIFGEKILDAGCGGGGYVDYLSEKGHNAFGIDKTEDILKIAFQKNRKGNFKKASIEDLPFSDNYFDCSYCFDVLEHVDDISALLELKRVTKHRILITVPQEDLWMKRYNLTFAHYQDKTHIRNYTSESLSELAQKLSPASFLVFSELFIPIESLINGLIDFDTRVSKLDCVTMRLKNYLLRKILKVVHFKEIPTSLVAVIDLR